MPEWLLSFAGELWDVLGEMAPFLLFGFLVAGVLYVLVPRSVVERHLGGRGTLPVVKATVFGIPLPLCSCGVIPVAASLRRHGASRGATIAFITATPQTGVDSIMVTYGLMGGVFAVFRPLAALVSGTLVGWMVGLWGGGKDETPASAAAQDARHTGESGGGKIRRALRYACLSLPRDVAKPLIAGLILAGAISALVPEDFFRSLIGGGIGAMVVMMAAGIPLYVCATASVPIAAALVAKGISPGAALVFLMTGPATNAATVAVVWKLMGRRTALIYLGTVAVTALTSGLLLDYVLGVEGASAAPPVPWMLPGFVKMAAAFVLLALLAAALLHRPRGKGAVALPDESETVALSVRGMHCTQCVESVTRALAGCEGVATAEVDLKRAKAVVRGKGFDIGTLCRAVEELGYSASPPDGPGGTRDGEG